MIDLHQTERDQLSEYRPPGGLVVKRANPEYGKLIVAPTTHAFTSSAAQHLNEVYDTESLSGPIDGRQGHSRRLGGVPGLGWGQAVIAAPAGC